MNTKKLTTTAIFLALVTVATLVINIPTPATKGYVNASEVAIFLSVLLLKDNRATLASSFGCALADLILGYSYYAPITLIVKAIEAFVGIKLVARMEKKYTKIIGLVIASLCMPLGYFIYEAFVYGKEMAIVSLVPNTVQGLFGVIGALIIYPFLNKAIAKYVN